MSEQAQSPPAPAAPPTDADPVSGVPHSRLSTRLESIREADEVAGAAGESELVYRRLGQDYAVPAGGYRLRRRWRRRAMVGVVATDGLMGLAAAGLALLRPDGVSGATVLALAPAGAAAWTVALTGAGVYERRSSGHGAAEFRRLVVAGVGLLAVTSTAVLAGAGGSSTVALRSLALVAVPLALVLSFAAHAAARVVLRLMRRRGRCQYRVLAIGMERSVAELVRATRRDSAAGLAVVGACLTKVRRTGERGAEVDGVPVLGSPADAVSAVRQLGADTVLITAWSDVSQDDLRRLSWELEGSGVELLVAPRLAGVATPRLHIRTVDGSPLVHVDEQEFTGLRRVAKDALDYGLSGLLVLMLSPVLIAVALAVRFTTPGPVLFRQQRVGRYGEPFHMYKFRSMFVDAEERRAALLQAEGDGVDRGPLFKMRDDPRVTPVGKFIRRYSLDELPQLFDVVLGRMSLVGPRPPLESEVEAYEHDVRRRLRVKPGMTGLWQVSGRSNLSWEDAVRLDLHYVENWSLSADLSIMARTVAAVLARDGAY